MSLLYSFFFLSHVSLAARDKHPHDRWSHCSVQVLSNNLQTSEFFIQSSTDYEFYKNDQFASYLGSFEDRDFLLSPDIIIIPNDEEDISTANKFANRCGYTVVARSGGHSYSGVSSCSDDYGPCIQIDMRNFVQFEPHYDDANDQNLITSVTIGVGHDIGGVQENLYPLGYVIPHGLCRDIGIGGHYQTSAIGSITRTYGFGLDYVISFRIVLANGDILTVTKDSHPELFFGVIGGNPGGFGVVLEYNIRTIKTSDVPHAYTYQFAYVYTKQTYQDIWDIWQGIISSDDFKNNFDIQLALFLVPRTVDGISITTFVVVNGVWTGVDNGPFFGGGFDDIFYTPFLDYATPFVTLDTNESLADVMLLQTTRIPTHFQMLDGLKILRHDVRGLVANEDLDPNLIANTIDDIDAIQQDPRLYPFIQSIPGGGKPTELQDTGNGFPWRNYQSLILYWVVYEDEADAKDARAFVTTLMSRNFDFWSAQTPHNIDIVAKTFAFTHGTGEVSLEAQWQSFYPSLEFYERLRNAKKRYDRRNVFANRLIVPPKKRRGKSNKLSLYERYRGWDQLRIIFQRFVVKVLTDDGVFAPLIDDWYLPFILSGSLSVDYFSVAAGATDVTYTGKDLNEAHREMREQNAMNEEIYDAGILFLEEVLNEFNLYEDEEINDEILDLWISFECPILGGTDCDYDDDY